MENIENIRKKVQEYRKYAAEVTCQIRQIDVQIATYNQLCYSMGSFDETSIEQLTRIKQQLMYYVAEKSRLEAEYQRINTQVKNERNVVQGMLNTKLKNVGKLQELPQFRNVSTDIFLNRETSSINECKIALSEIDAFLQGNYSEDSTASYGQKKL